MPPVKSGMKRFITSLLDELSHTGSPFFFALRAVKNIVSAKVITSTASDTIAPKMMSSVRFSAVRKVVVRKLRKGLSLLWSIKAAMSPTIPALTPESPLSEMKLEDLSIMERISVRSLRCSRLLSILNFDFY